MLLRWDCLINWRTFKRGDIMKLKLFYIFCACVAIVIFAWWSILAIGVCTLVYFGVKILLETKGKQVYNWVLKKLT